MITKTMLKTKERFGNTRIFVFFEGEPIALPGQARANYTDDIRDTKTKRIAYKALRQVMKDLNPNAEPVSLKQIAFSRKAGCSCGCSPGFIVKGLTCWTDLYVDVKR